MNELFNWDIKEKDIQVAGGQMIEKKKAIIRTDTDSVLSVVNKTYQPLYNHDLNLIAQSIVQSESLSGSKVFEIENGKKLIVQLEMPEKKYVGEDILTEYLTLINSHDASTAFYIGFGNRVAFCKNQFNYFKKNANFRVQHSKSMMVMIENTLKVIDKIHEERIYRNEMFEKFADFKLAETEVLAKEMVEYVKGVDLDINRSEAKESFDIGANKYTKAEILYDDILTSLDNQGETLWGLFNGVTYNTNHHAGNRLDINKHLHFGSGARENEKAFEFCLNSVIKNVSVL